MPLPAELRAETFAAAHTSATLLMPPMIPSSFARLEHHPDAIPAAVASVPALTCVTSPGYAPGPNHQALRDRA
jgi:hypothetical protein